MNVRSYLLLSSFLLAACISQRPAPVFHYGSADGKGSAGVHTVTKGENLWSISQRYDIVMRDLVMVNGLRAPFMLNSGQRLTLPAPRVYRVRQGDSVSEISRIFEVSQTELAQINGLAAPYVVQPGQVLKLPGVVQEVSKRPSVVPHPSPLPKGEGVKKVSAAAKQKISAKTPKRSSSKFLRPVSGKLLSSYGPKTGGLHNDGINILAPRGTPVKAAENGVVVYAGSELKGTGNLVLLRHEGGWMTAYAHLDNIGVKRGQVVKRGSTLGGVGSTGSVDRPQLHFEVRKGKTAVNPAKYL